MPSNTFCRLSCALTGEASLDERLSAELEQRILAHYPADLKTLLDAFEAQGSPKNAEQAALAALGSNAKSHLVAREIIRIWFTGQFETPFEGVDAPRTPQQWEQGLLWKILKAPAPGFSKNPYGAWASKPE